MQPGDARPGYRNQPSGWPPNTNSPHSGTGIAEPTKPKWSRFKIAFTVIGSAIAIASGTVGILTFIQAQANSIAEFSGDLSGLSNAKSFDAFVDSHDEKVVKLDIECATSASNYTLGSWVPADSRCLFMPDAVKSDSFSELLLISTGSYNVHQYMETPGGVPSKDGVDVMEFFVPQSGTDAIMANGPKGAGWAVVKGYFSVNKGQVTVADPATTQYQLHAVNISNVK